MAAVNIDLSTAPRDLASTTRRYHVQYTGATLYVAGGDTGLADALGVGQVFEVLGTISNGTNVLIPFYDRTTGKLQWFDNGTGAEAAGNLSAYVGTLEVVAV